MSGTARATIFALSSGALPAGIAVVRVSGPQAFAALTLLTGAPLPRSRAAALRTICDPADASVIDRALVLAFAAPASATGEDVVELHLHGGIAVVAAALAALGRLPGLRGAEPGEFTKRAFDNCRLDLSQAEGLADLIAAETEAQRRAALAQAGGALRVSVEGWSATLLGLLADAEAGLDFAESEDDVTPLTRADADAAVAGLIAQIDAALADAARGRQLRDGLTIVVSGPPNVGKSSLVNALVKSDIAIVSPLPGTTRDVIEARLDLGGVLVTLVDTAGLRESDDPVEAEGIARARARAAAADLVLALYCGDGAPGQGLAVRTKIDLGGPAGGGLAVSNATGEGIAALLDWLAGWARDAVRSSEPALLANARQADACRCALDELEQLTNEGDPVLRAEGLRLALRALGSITGAVGVEAVLDAIFSRFCIGK